MSASSHSQVTGPTVVRSSQQRIVVTLSSGLLLLVFVGASAAAKHESDRLTYAILALLCAFGIFRGVRSGYLAVSSISVTVRTIFRTSKFDLATIQSVDPVSVAQATRRVFPVISFLDGSQYKLSEFFAQKRAYQRSPEDSIVTLAIRAIESARQ